MARETGEINLLRDTCAGSGSAQDDFSHCVGRSLSIEGHVNLDSYTMDCVKITFREYATDRKEVEILY